MLSGSSLGGSVFASPTTSAGDSPLIRGLTSLRLLADIARGVGQAIHLALAWIRGSVEFWDSTVYFSHEAVLHQVRIAEKLSQFLTAGNSSLQGAGVPCPLPFSLSSAWEAESPAADW